MDQTTEVPLMEREIDYVEIERLAGEMGHISPKSNTTRLRNLLTRKLGYSPLKTYGELRSFCDMNMRFKLQMGYEYSSENRLLPHAYIGMGPARLGLLLEHLKRVGFQFPTPTLDDLSEDNPYN